MLATLRVMPLMVFPLTLFTLCALALGGSWTVSTFFEVDMFSGQHWIVSAGDAFLLVALLVLFVEIVKAVNTEATEILNHGLSMLVAVVCTVLFVTTSIFTNSTFFIFTSMAYFDVAAGFIITIVAARRDIGH